MATGSQHDVRANGTHIASKPLELAISIPRSPGMRFHLRLTVTPASITLFLSSASIDSGPGAVAPMGSFVYAMPDRYNPSQPMSTALYSLPSSLDFTTRMAKILVRKTGRPCYVGSSIDLSRAASGGTFDEEMEAFRAVVHVVTTAVQRYEHKDEEEESDEEEEDEEDEEDG